MAHQRIVVIGGSAGAIHATQTLIAGLPTDFPTAVLVTIHIAPTSPRVLDRMLGRAGTLPAAFAEDGEEIAPGRVYVAPPDRHMIVDDGYLRVRRGPLENSSRPAIDPLFRSAALSFGGGTIAVLLSGMLSDGVSGLIAVKSCGGLVIVQDPADAEYGDLPRNAIAMGSVDHIAPLARLPGLLATLVQEPPRPDLPPPPELKLEIELAMHERGIGEGGKPKGEPSAFTCPECGGALWHTQEGELSRFRCHIGHAYTIDALDASQQSEFDRAVATALRILEERILVMTTFASSAHRRSQAHVSRHWERHITDMKRQAAQLRGVLTEQNGEPKRVK